MPLLLIGRACNFVCESMRRLRISGTCSSAWPLLLLVWTISAYSLPVHYVDKRLSSSNVDSRTLCRQTNGTCDFYSHCIESLFPCGDQGFALSYAETRCNSIRLFRTSEASCSSCLRSPQVVRWARNQKQCLQKQMYELVIREFQDRRPDPPTCLLLERRAFEEMDACYDDEQTELCAALDHSSDLESLQQDLTVVRDTFNTSRYYGRVAERGLVEAVRKCSHPASSDIADSLISEPSQLQLVFCIAFQELGSDVPNPGEGVLESQVADILSRPMEQFSYKGKDRDDRCRMAVPVGVQQRAIFHLVTFSPNSSDPLQLNSSYNRHTFRSNIAFFEYAPLRSNSSCGNGIREGAEICDEGVFNGAPSTGCDFSCVALEGHECASPGQLQPSVCQEEECSDGQRTSSEACDDNNSSDGDGCSSSCTVEPGYECSFQYNQTSTCRLKPDPPEPSQSSLPTPRTSTMVSPPSPPTEQAPSSTSPTPPPSLPPPTVPPTFPSTTPPSSPPPYSTPTLSVDTPASSRTLHRNSSWQILTLCVTVVLVLIKR